MLLPLARLVPLLNRRRRRVPDRLLLHLALRRLALQVIVARGRGVFAYLSTHAAHVCSELPDLKIGHAIAKRRHSVRASGDNRCEHVFRFSAVEPFVVHQWWSHSATAH